MIVQLQAGDRVRVESKTTPWHRFGVVDHVNDQTRLAVVEYDGGGVAYLPSEGAEHVTWEKA